MNQNFDEIDKQIIDICNDFLSEADENNYAGNTIWTRRLKEKIGDLGWDLDYDVAIGGFRDKFEKEWLYDIVWYQEDDEGRLIRVPLIVESEWDINYAGIKYDFEKLLVGNAQKRFMICQSKPVNIEGLLDKFKKAIDVFEENYGDTFLFAILDSESESEFHYWTYKKLSPLA
jgi:hypothetical protein